MKIAKETVYVVRRGGKIVARSGQREDLERDGDEATVDVETIESLPVDHPDLLALDKATVWAVRKGGKIAGVFTRPPVDPKERAACEELPADHPDLVAFENRPPPAFDPVKARANAQGTPQERLARAGLSVEDLRALLGGKP